MVTLPLHLILHAKWVEPLLESLDAVGEVKMQFNNLALPMVLHQAQEVVHRAEFIREALNASFWTKHPRLIQLGVLTVPLRGATDWRFEKRVLHARYSHESGPVETVRRDSRNIQRDDERMRCSRHDQLKAIDMSSLALWNLD